MKRILLTSFVILSFSASAQVVYEPLYRNIYPYLARLSQRGVIDLHDIVLPIPRKDIVGYLKELDQNQIKLTPLERKELLFLKKEYTQDINIVNDSTLLSTSKVKILKYSNIDRFRFVASQDKQFTINFQPIYGYNFSFKDGTHSLSHRWSGFWAYGYIGKNFGYSFDFRGNQEDGTGVDSTKTFSPETGVIARFRKNGLEYTDVKATLSYNWKWGNITIGKDYMPIGYGSNGKIILSTKAPSFPLIRLDIKPVKWFSFNYAHIWLNSDVVDSTKIRYSGIPNTYQVSDVPKFMATHSLIFSPFKGFKFLLGESIIYNDQVKLAYLTPIMFFRAFSHYQGELTRSNTVSNSQFFTQISSRNHIPNTHLYASFYVDEVSLRNTGRNQTAYNIGASITDFPIKNLFLNTDYTRTRPFAYIHFLPMQTYQNAGYNLGHWIGPNADQWFNELRYRIIRGLEFKLLYSVIRKGSIGTPKQQTNENGTPFLWGNVKKMQNLEYNLTYEIIHDFFLNISYQNINFDSNISNPNTQNIVSIRINYGF